jgi:hypothetical protein
MLKSVWRRGAGAYSVGTPGRKGMGRNQWAMGRVNAFLRILSGSAPSDKDYKQDNDLLPKSHPKHSEQKMSKYLFADEDKKEIVGIAMVPDMQIPRKDKDGNIYFVDYDQVFQLNPSTDTVRPFGARLEETYNVPLLARTSLVVDVVASNGKIFAIST